MRGCVYVQAASGSENKPLARMRYFCGNSFLDKCMEIWFPAAAHSPQHVPFLQYYCFTFYSFFYLLSRMLTTLSLEKQTLKEWKEIKEADTKRINFQIKKTIQDGPLGPGTHCDIKDVSVGLVDVRTPPRPPFLPFSFSISSQVPWPLC